jgi:hypothetical protein
MEHRVFAVTEIWDEIIGGLGEKTGRIEEYIKADWQRLQTE